MRLDPMAIEFDSTSRKEILLHLAIILASFTLLVLAFFYLYLPYTTHHNQTVTVPDLTGMDARGIESYLSERDLDVQIDDSTFNPKGAPFAVYAQFPAAGSKVKTGRKIYISINSFRPPMVKMPDLKNRSFINAQGELDSYGLQVGEVEYVPDIQQNMVLAQFFNGKEIEPGTQIPKGSKVNLKVADGLGQQEFDLQDIVGKTFEEAELTIQGAGLQVGTKIYVEDATEPAGTIIRQKPEALSKVRIGEAIDLWIAGSDPKSESLTE
jgi:eukaryotic-like serine/threonine-protein kinase